MHADIEEAIELGIYFTPMVFINGKQLRGWQARNALVRAVDKVAATNPPPMTAAADHPPEAAEKYINDWRDNTARRNMASDSVPHMLGPADAPARIVIWGDYQEPGTASLDARIRRILADRNGDVSYTFRHYPFNTSCNPHLVVPTRHGQACRMAQAAEAAARFGGEDAYWGMHEWLFANQTAFTDAKLQAQVTKMGLPMSAFMSELSSANIAAAIGNDCSVGKRVGLRGIPMLFVNEKQVPAVEPGGGAGAGAYCRGGGAGRLTRVRNPDPQDAPAPAAPIELVERADVQLAVRAFAERADVLAVVGFEHLAVSDDLAVSDAQAPHASGHVVRVVVAALEERIPLAAIDVAAGHRHAELPSVVHPRARAGDPVTLRPRNGCVPSRMRQP